MESINCSVCGEPYPLDQLTEFDGQLICSSCLGIETMVCSRCGRRIWNDDNAGDDTTPLCHSCYERLYTNCGHCGRTILYDDAYYEDDDQDDPLCWHCYCQTCQRQYEILRKRRRNFVVFRRGGNKTKRFLAQKECSRFAVSDA